MGLKTGTTDKAGAVRWNNCWERDAHYYGCFECRSITLMHVLLLHLHLFRFISANFALKTVVQKGGYTTIVSNSSDGKEDNVTAVAKPSIVQRIGSSTTPALQFTPKSTSECPLKKARLLVLPNSRWPGFTGWGLFIFWDKPSLRWFRKRKLKKPPFWKAWWNQLSALSENYKNRENRDFFLYFPFL